MQLFAILHELGRRWFVVAVALVVSVAVGMSVTYRVSPGLPPQFHARQYSVGVASARVLINTPSSIVADLNPNGGGSLAIHAQLLGNVLASQQVRTTIADSARVPLSDLVVEPLSVGGVVQTPLAVSAPAPTGASTLSVNADPLLPLITINAQAPNPVTAAALANGAVTALQSYIQTVAASEKIPTSRRTVVTSLGAAQSGSTTRGPSRLYGVIATIFLFGLCCYLIIVISGARSRLRALRQNREAAPRPSLDLKPLDAASQQIPPRQPADHRPSVPNRDGGLHESALPQDHRRPPGEADGLADEAHSLTHDDASVLLAMVGSEPTQTRNGSEKPRTKGRGKGREKTSRGRDSR